MRSILHIVASMDPQGGGVCQAVKDIITGLEQQEISSEVLCFDLPDAQFLKGASFPIHALGPTQSPYAYSPKLKVWLSEHMMHYEVLIIHGLWLYNTYGTYRIWNQFKKKEIPAMPRLYIMPHGMLDPYFQKAPDRRLKALRNSVFWRLFERKAINGADGLLFTCEEELLLARKTFSSYHPRAELNVGLGTSPPPPFETDFEDAFYKAVPKLDNKPFLLFLSRIHPKKGVDLLIGAYLQILNRNPEVPDLVVAGPGLESDYGCAMLELGKHPKIHFPGMLTGPKKWGAFYGCEAFILPSHQENFGIVVAEALACGRPVLISNKINIWREVEAGEGGLVFQDSLECTLKALTRFLTLNSIKTEELGKHASDTFLKHFEITQAAKTMITKLGLDNG